MRQQTSCCRVVDAETGKPLPYASIYVAEGKGTLTNEDGVFLFRAKLEKERQEMEDQYVGCIEAQQRTLDMLKKVDQNYILSKKVILAKIAYLKALIEETKK